VPLPRNIEVFAFCNEKLPILRLDLTFLKRILVNLVTNAIQAMPNGGKLTIKAFEKDKKVYITVQDTGVGIPEEIKPKLFQPLMTTKSKGQGFGLAVVKRLVERLGGKISFDSEAGKGTTFTIELPVES
jgi:signal transduction histidine kinase